MRTQTFTPGIHFNYTETMLLMPEHLPQLSLAASFGRFGRPLVVAPRNAASAGGRGRKGRCHFKPRKRQFWTPEMLALGFDCRAVWLRCPDHPRIRSRSGYSM
jgi:hypothetical protein